VNGLDRDTEYPSVRAELVEVRTPLGFGKPHLQSALIAILVQKAAVESFIEATSRLEVHAHEDPRITTMLFHLAKNGSDPHV
jgi:hypothetical protein